MLLARVAGMNPRRFGGRDLLAEIEKRRRSDGSISGFVSYTAFGVMALRASGASAGSETIKWLVASQNSDGGFGVARSSASDSDMTGAALQALASVGRGRGRAAQRAAGWLRENQNGDGGFGQFKGRDSNSQSTSYAVQGLVAAGTGGDAAARARGYLMRRQRRDGSVAYSSSSSQTPVWVTAQALMALKGKPLPLAAVPRSAPRPGERVGGRRGWRGRRARRAAAAARPAARRATLPAAGGAAAAGEAGAGAGAVGGVTAGAEPGATAPEGGAALPVDSAPKSGAAEVEAGPDLGGAARARRACSACCGACTGTCCLAASPTWDSQRMPASDPFSGAFDRPEQLREFYDAPMEAAVRKDIGHIDELCAPPDRRLADAVRGHVLGATGTPT